jgi:hypothetical protein
MVVLLAGQHPDLVRKGLVGCPVMQLADLSILVDMVLWDRALEHMVCPTKLDTAAGFV